MILDYGCPKKRKHGMPEKHDPKKNREREKRKRGVVISEKRDDTRERTNALRSKTYHHSSIHPHMCTF